LGNRIIFYQPLNTADSDFQTVTPIFVGDFAGQTATLLFTLNHVADGTPSILLDNITFSAVPAVFQAQDFTYTTNNDATITITGYTGSSGALSIPSEINGLPVTSIGSWAFQHNSSLTSVTIPDSVTNIGSYALSGCGSLTGVCFKGNAPGVASDVFGGDNNATVYYLPGTTGWSDFSTNTGITPVLWNPQVQTSDGSFGVQTNQFGFNITGTSNLVIVVEACTNPANPTWYPVGTNTLTGGSSYFSDPQWTNYTRRFYRLRSP
jgi:hypothetical protein